MRFIGEINSEEQAKRFGDYLLANNIPCDIEDEEDGTWSIWIHDDDQIEKADRYRHDADFGSGFHLVRV